MKGKASLLLTWILFVILTGCTGYKAYRLYKGGSVAPGSAGITSFHFESPDDMIILPVTFGTDSTHYNFLLDTGTSSVIIDSLLSVKLGLDPVATTRIRGVFGYQQEAGTVKLPPVHLKNILLNDIAGAVMDLDKIRMITGKDIDGILGSNALRYFSLLISYQNREVIFYHSSPSVPDRPGMKLKIDNSTLGRPVTDAEVEGIRMQVLLDNCYMGWFSAPAGQKKKMGITDSAILKSVGIAEFDVFSGSQTTLVRLKEVKTGDIVLRNIPSRIEYNSQAFLGQKVLQKFDILLDYPGKRVWFIPVDGSGTTVDFSSKPFGPGCILIRDSSDRLMVSAMWPHSPAAQAGIRIGDQVISIDGKPVEKIPLFTIRKKLEEGDPGGLVELEILRDNSRVKFAIHKRTFLP